MDHDNNEQFENEEDRIDWRRWMRLIIEGYKVVIGHPLITDDALKGLQDQALRDRPY